MSAGYIGVEVILIEHYETVFGGKKEIAFCMQV
jgi:hypothetical protein